jgi:acyl-CoA synthetase (NDP forming)/GNAT superfamily N-acetyltransferase
VGKGLRGVAGYPVECERPGLLSDGRSVLLRPVKPEDTEGLVAMYGRLSRQSIAFRFLGPMVTIRAEAMRRFTEIDYVDDFALIALLGDRILGEARFSRSEEIQERAEVTFVIEDEFQGHGLGGLLLEHIAVAARHRGIAVLEANILADNIRMLSTIANSGYRHQTGGDGAVVTVDIAVDPSAPVLARASRRDQDRTRTSLVPLLCPRSVALVGASDRAGSVGAALTTNLSANSSRTIYLVNPTLSQINGRPVVASVRDIAGPVDLAVIAVPADRVAEVIRDCAAVGVMAAVVVSVGFSETGAAGEQYEHDVIRFARQHGMRVLGPVSMGVVNCSPDVGLRATFAPSFPPPGAVAMSSQSGMVGLFLLDRASRYGLGLSSFVSIGNAGDITTVDLLQWWRDDPDTAVVLIHADRFDEPREFARLARAIAPRKPLVVVHPGGSSGRDEYRGSEHGQHRHHRVDSEYVLNQLFRQSGVIRAHRQEQLFDLGLLLAHQPVPEGNRVLVVTNGVGPGRLTVSACRAAGLESPVLNAATWDRVMAVNPTPMTAPGVIDVTPMATPDSYSRVLDATLHDPGVDAIIVIFAPPLVTREDEIAATIREASRNHPNKTVLASFLGEPGAPAALRDDAVVVPSFTFPETAAATLGLVATYGQWRRQPGGVQPHLSGIRRSAARSVMSGAAPGPIADDDAVAILAHYGIALSDSDAGPDESSSTPIDTHRIDGATVRIELEADPIFGPVLSLTVDSAAAQLFGDIAVRITPLSDRDADDMMHALRAFPLVAGDAAQPRDIDALRETLLRLSAMVEDLPEISALSLRVRVHPLGRGAAVVTSTIWRGSPDPARIPVESTVGNSGPSWTTDL